ncbi:hypothetical protein GE061_011286 [Apolygus lucorum]|uniref:Uncharacterized protein n=1 Tax=Apolygus lucorum TaxID=248454 RepID=A0A8S9Y111_APOLU|nr:hypothetical protein GE061_011286 [Apolygus lucorum]
MEPLPNQDSLLAMAGAEEDSGTGLTEAQGSLGSGIIREEIVITQDPSQEHPQDMSTKRKEPTERRRSRSEALEGSSTVSGDTTDQTTNIHGPSSREDRRSTMSLTPTSVSAGFGGTENVVGESVKGSQRNQDSENPSSSSLQLMSTTSWKGCGSTCTGCGYCTESPTSSTTYYRYYSKEDPNDNVQNRHTTQSSGNDEGQPIETLCCSNKQFSQQLSGDEENMREYKESIQNLAAGDAQQATDHIGGTNVVGRETISVVPFQPSTSPGSSKFFEGLYTMNSPTAVASSCFPGRAQAEASFTGALSTEEAGGTHTPSTAAASYNLPGGVHTGAISIAAASCKLQGRELPMSPPTGSGGEHTGDSSIAAASSIMSASSNAGVASTQRAPKRLETTCSMIGQIKRRFMSPRSGVPHSPMWAQGHSEDQFRNEGSAVPPYLPEQVIRVPEGQIIHFCYECTVFFLSFVCTQKRISQFPHRFAPVCTCITQYIGRSSSTSRTTRRVTQVEKVHRAAFRDLLQGPSRFNEWLERWWSFLFQTGGLTSGHRCKKSSLQRNDQQKERKESMEKLLWSIVIRGVKYDIDGSFSSQLNQRRILDLRISFDSHTFKPGREENMEPFSNSDSDLVNDGTQEDLLEVTAETEQEETMATQETSQAEERGSQAGTSNDFFRHRVRHTAPDPTLSSSNQWEFPTLRSRKPKKKSTAAGDVADQATNMPREGGTSAASPSAQRPSRTINGRNIPGRAPVTTSIPTGYYDRGVRNVIRPMLAYMEGYINGSQRNHTRENAPPSPTEQMPSASWMRCGPSCTGCDYCPQFQRYSDIPHDVLGNNYAQNEGAVPEGIFLSPLTENMSYLMFGYPGRSHPHVPPVFHQYHRYFSNAFHYHGAEPSGDQFGQDDTYENVHAAQPTGNDGVQPTATPGSSTEQFPQQQYGHEETIRGSTAPTDAAFTVPGGRHAGASSSRPNIHSLFGQVQGEPETPQRNIPHWTMWAPRYYEDQFRIEGAGAPPYLSAARGISVPEGQNLHICYTCMVFFLSPRCSFQAEHPPVYPLLCYCLAQHKKRSFTTLHTTRKTAQTERTHRVGAMKALLQNPTRIEEWLRQWGPYLFQSGGLTNGHRCKKISPGTAQQKVVIVFLFMFRLTPAAATIGSEKTPDLMVANIIVFLKAEGESDERKRLSTNGLSSSENQKFNPPIAAWWGGWWERVMRMIKELMRRNLGQAALTYEALTTVVCDIEAVINARPLTYVGGATTSSSRKQMSYNRSPRSSSFKTSSQQRLISTLYSLEITAQDGTSMRRAQPSSLLPGSSEDVTSS